MAARVETLSRHLSAAAQQHTKPGAAASDDDVVIVYAVRTPITKAKRGGFSTTTPDILLAAVLSAAAAKSGVPKELIGDISVGNVLQPGGGAMAARISQLEAGLHHGIPLSTTNRQCSSGLQAVANIFFAIKSGAIDAGIGAGMESMSFNSMTDAAPTSESQRLEDVSS
jgi:acetyl-CoA acyltransferase 1